MTIASETSIVSSVANGVATVFPYTFIILDSSHLVVTIDDAVQSSGFSVSGVGSGSGGSVTFTTAPAKRAIVVLRRVVPYTQPTDLRNAGQFFPETHETVFDRLTMMAQQNHEDAKRSIRVPLDESGGDDLVLPSVADRANKAMIFDLNGHLTAGEMPASGVISAPMAPVVGAASLASARAAMGPWDDALVMSLGGNTARSLAERESDKINVKDYGAKGNVTTDDTAALQAAINATPTGGSLCIPSGVYKITGTLTISVPCTVFLEGTIQPNGVGGNAPVVKIRASNVTIRGAGGIVGHSSSSGWSGIAVGLDDADGTLRGVVIDGLTISSLDLPLTGTTSQFGIGLYSALGATVRNCSFYRPGGFGIYTQFCRGSIISGNTIEEGTHTGINVSAGVDNRVCGNTVFRMKYFGIKAGYGIVETVSNNESATYSATTKRSVFTVAGANVGRKWLIGSAVHNVIINSSVQVGRIVAIVDLSGYRRITVMGFTQAPAVGSACELADTGTIFEGNSITLTGDNGFDVNITDGMQIIGNSVRLAGQYIDQGNNLMLGAGVWIGADAQGAVNGWQSNRVSVRQNTISNSAGSAIEIFSTNDVLVSDNSCFDYNELKDPATLDSSYGGIEVGRLGYSLVRNVRICDNICRSPWGYGIMLVYCLYGTVDGNQVDSLTGINIRDSVGANTVRGNVSTSTGTNGWALRILSGGQNSAGVVIDANTLNANAGGNALAVTDANATGIVLTRTNSLSTSGGGALVENSAAEIKTDLDSQISTSTAISSTPGEVRTEQINRFVASGATIVLCEVAADNGTCCTIEVLGAVWGTAKGEFFRVNAGGNAITSSRSFTSLGTPGGATLDLADFVLSGVSGNARLRLSYTNNSGTSLRLSASIRMLSRF